MVAPGPLKNIHTYTARRTRVVERGRRRYVLNFSWSEDSPSIIVSFPGFIGHDTIRVFDPAGNGGKVTINSKEQFLAKVNEYMRTLPDDNLRAHWEAMHPGLSHG